MALSRAKKAVAAATIALATVGPALPAFAQQKGGTANAQNTCRALGGTWYPDVLDGVEGGRCRVNLFYGCGFSLHWDNSGRLHGAEQWCIGNTSISW